MLIEEEEEEEEVAKRGDSTSSWSYITIT